ncbi:MAG TPA: hypothetical protein VGR54_06525 [Nitrosopumilaceae archaeon]|nr:hypothetical protein [Nitrosopumilaceae archaeon]
MKKKLLKGNYLPESNPEMEEKNSSSSTTTHEFEKKAIERLGGSIAFVRGGKLYDENN